MRFAKSTVAASAFIGATACAQTNVAMYGLLDTGIEYVSNADAAGHALVRLPGVSGELPSRLGFRGEENLGGGVKALFALETGFNVRRGDLGQGGRMFGRQSWVGLDGPWGTVSFGRQYNMAFWVLADAEMLGPDIHGIGALDNYLPNARSDNTVAYKGRFDRWTVGATYSFGRDGAGTGNSPGQGTCAGEGAATQGVQCREWSAMVKYDAPRFGVATAYSRQHGGTNAAANFFDGVTPQPLASGEDYDARMQANGYVRFGRLKVGAGWIGRSVRTASPALPDVRSHIVYTGAQYFITDALMLDGEALHIRVKQHDTAASLVTARLTYFLSKTTAVYVKGGHLWNGARSRFSVSAGGGGTTPAAGASQIGLMAGLRHAF